MTPTVRESSTAHSELTIDSVDATVNHAHLIRSKPLLQHIYLDNYRFFERTLNRKLDGVLLELGSGGGFLKDVIPGVITSDVIALPGVDRVISAVELPFEDRSLAAIMMVNVFHHIQRADRFLSEAERTLQSGGVLVMVEPAVTLFSRWIYTQFHHEPFDTSQRDWALTEGAGCHRRMAPYHG